MMEIFKSKPTMVGISAKYRQNIDKKGHKKRRIVIL